MPRVQYTGRYGVEARVGMRADRFAVALEAVREDSRPGWASHTALRERFQREYPRGTWIGDEPTAIQHFAIAAALGVVGADESWPVYVTACGTARQGVPVGGDYGIPCQACLASGRAKPS